MSSESVGVTLLELPDDALLMALQLLPVTDLLACRLVCRRLGGLALHRDVWRQRALTAGDPSARVVLRLAPCLRKVTVVGELFALLPVMQTHCAIQHLELKVDQYHDLFGLVVRRQEVLGGLRHLKLTSSSGSADAVDELMKILAASSTLQSLDIEVKGWDHDIGRDSGALELLARMPQLQKLACSWLYGLETLAACKSLTDLVLYESSRTFFQNHPLTVDGTAELFRRASHLRSLSVDLSDTTYLNPEAGITGRLMDALAVSGRSLEKLSLTGSSFVLVPPLCRALTALSHLTVLRIDDVYSEELDRARDELLRAISVSTPALQLLELINRYEAMPYNEPCPHIWVHSDVLKNTFRAIPALHIVTDMRMSDNSCQFEDCEECDFCRLGCHEEIFYHPFVDIGLHSHSIDECPAPKYRGDWYAPRGYPYLVPSVWYQI